MLVRIYWTTWALFALTGALLFATGYMTMFAAVLMGFIAFGITFMGMIGVLPSMVAHPAPERVVEPKLAPTVVQQPSSAKALAVLKSA